MTKTKKYIFITGGVLSGVGKGVTAASIGAVLKASGIKVSIQKCDPYLNVDAGLLNPKEHGECFVTKDGAETDLDLGHYERFLDDELTRKNITLSGQLFSELIGEERRGVYGGQTVQMVPHLTNKIKNKILEAASNSDSDIHIVEIGGTVGDYEGLSYIEAIRQFSSDVGRNNCLFVHVVYVPFIGTSREFKTKPAQNALNDLRGFGIVPDGVVVRTEKPATESVVEKISLFGGIEKDSVLLMPNVNLIYEIPIVIAKSGFVNTLSHFWGHQLKPNLKQWEQLVFNFNNLAPVTLNIGLVAKYMDNNDTYISVIEALKSAAYSQRINIKITWIKAEGIDEKELDKFDGLVVPGGFGMRGSEGKIKAANYAFTKDIPYLGLCLGLQVAVIAAGRRAGYKDANSTEFNPATKNDVVYIMPSQSGKELTGGTMRLGNYSAVLEKNTKTYSLYGQTNVVERHRHRYEVNQKYLPDIEKAGLIISGKSPDGKLVEFIEGKNKSFYIATQAHPEFKSRPYRPHPLFSGFIEAAIKKQQNK